MRRMRVLRLLEIVCLCPCFPLRRFLPLTDACHSSEEGEQTRNTHKEYAGANGNDVVWALVGDVRLGNDGYGAAAKSQHHWTYFCFSGRARENSLFDISKIELVRSQAKNPAGGGSKLMVPQSDEVEDITKQRAMRT